MNTTRLAVLGLLARRPMYGYEVQQYLQLGYADRWAGVQTGSIYHALKSMEGDGLVAVQATEQIGHRLRAIYAITDDGLAQFRQLLREAWHTPSWAAPATLYAALTFLDDLPRAEVLAALDERIAMTERALDQLDAGEAAKTRGPEVPYYLRAIFANSRQHIQVDLRFLRHLRETLPAAPADQSVQPPPLPEPPAAEIPANDEGPP